MVSKTAELIRLAGVILLSLLLLGIVFLIAVFTQQLIFEKPIASPLQTAHASSFETVSSLRRQYEMQLEQSIKNALEKITGPQTVQATVHADFNLMQETDDQSILLPKTSVVRSQTVAENGTDSKGSDLYEQTTQYDFSTQKITKNNTFEQIKKLSITVLIDGVMENGSFGNELYHPRSAMEMETYTNLIHSITDFNPERGDTLELINLPFNETTSFWSNIPVPMLFSAGIIGLFILFSIFILLSFIRPMMKQLMTPTPALPIVNQHTPKPKENKTVLGKTHNLFLKDMQRSIQILRNWLNQPATEQGTGLYRVSVLLLALGEEIIQTVFVHLTDSEMIEISRTMGTLGHIPAPNVQIIATQFIKQFTKTPDLINTEETTQTVLQKTLPTEKIDHLLKEINAPVAGKTIWDKLAQLDTTRLMPIFEKESAPVLAVILYHLPDQKAGEILSALPTEKRASVIENLTQTGPADATTLHTIEQALEQQIQEIYSTPFTQSGSEKLSSILSLMDKTAEDDFLKPLYHTAPRTAQEIAQHIMSFEQLSTWDDESIQTLLKAAPKETIVIALKGASDQIKDAFSRNMSPRIWADLTKEIAQSGAIRINQIDTAQLELLKLAQELKRTHKINLKDPS